MCDALECKSKTESLIKKFIHSEPVLQSGKEITKQYVGIGNKFKGYEINTDVGAIEILCTNRDILIHKDGDPCHISDICKIKGIVADSFITGMSFNLEHKIAIKDNSNEYFNSLNVKIDLFNKGFNTWSRLNIRINNGDGDCKVIVSLLGHEFYLLI